MKLIETLSDRQQVWTIGGRSYTARVMRVYGRLR